MPKFNPWIDLPTSLVSYAFVLWMLLRWARRGGAGVLEKTQTTPDYSSTHLNKGVLDRYLIPGDVLYNKVFVYYHYLDLD